MGPLNDALQVPGHDGGLRRAEGQDPGLEAGGVRDQDAAPVQPGQGQGRRTHQGDLWHRPQDRQGVQEEDDEEEGTGGGLGLDGGLGGRFIDLAADALACQVRRLIDTIDVQPVQIQGPYSMELFGSKNYQWIYQIVA